MSRRRVTSRKPKTFRALGHCEKHQKLTYIDRKTARRAAQAMPSEQYSAYRCDALEGMWHIGRLPEAVRRNEVSRGDYYGRDEDVMAIDDIRRSPAGAHDDL